jgi:hypothetical protein
MLFPLKEFQAKLLPIGDTHAPKRAHELPRQMWDEVDRAGVAVWVQQPCAGRALTEG